MAEFVKGYGIVLTHEERETLKEASMGPHNYKPIMPNLKEAFDNFFEGWEVKTNYLDKKNENI